MNRPPDYFAAIDATWPAARRLRVGPWTIREGKGGGSRVSAATADGYWTPSDIPDAETAMRDLGQPPLFMLRDGEPRLEAELARRGYAELTPTQLYAGPADAIAGETHGITRHWPPVPGQIRLWDECGIDAPRIAVMHRAATPRSSFAAFRGGRIVGVGFAALHGHRAMLHALDVAPAHRRQGIATHMLGAIGRWALDVGGSEICLAVTKENFAANALYVNNAMAVVASYHYRIGQQEPD